MLGKKDDYCDCGNMGNTKYDTQCGFCRKDLPPLRPPVGAITNSNNQVIKSFARKNYIKQVIDEIEQDQNRRYKVLRFFLGEIDSID